MSRWAPNPGYSTGMSKLDHVIIVNILEVGIV